MKKLKYTFRIHPSLSMNTDMILDKISTTLQSKRGWVKHGYSFEYTNHKKDSDFIFLMVPEEVIEKKCKFSGLSCADKNIIYLNVKRWKRGSVASKLPLDMYRTYLIMHEVGHILGRGHHQCESIGKAPVMMQQTKGIGHCTPNCWPLNWE